MDLLEVLLILELLNNGYQITEIRLTIKKDRRKKF